MSEPLYKAIFHYSVGDLMSRDGRSVGLLKRIEQWLDEHGRRHHYVMAYLNDDPDDQDAGELVVVLNDRDTALMLKLSMV